MTFKNTWLVVGINEAIMEWGNRVIEFMLGSKIFDLGL